MNDITALHLSLTFGALVLTWQLLWKNFALDHVRQNLFSIRDRLFDMASSGENGFTFKSPVYLAFRDQLNTRIRYAHRISPAHIWLITLCSKLTGLGIPKYPIEPSSTVDAMIREIEAIKLRTELMAMKERANRQLVHYVVMTSPVLLTVFASSGLFIAVTELVKALWRRSLIPFGKLERLVREREIYSRPAKEIEAQAIALVESPVS